MEYKLEARPKAKKEAVISAENYRITLLTSQMVRLEYSENGCFEDRATQTVLNREFEVPKYQVKEREDQLEILTEALRIVYNKQKFSAHGLYIQLRGNYSAYNSTWYYGDKGSNLGGTARTLDEADGAVKLEDGILSQNGFTLIDDSNSSVILEDGWVEPRENREIDLYFLGYGRSYRKCLKDFFRLTGKTPLLPRYALGNWWSRFHPYTEESYHELLDCFAEEGVPFSIAVLDMDWHLTKVDARFGSGWTGYSWNHAYFPKPERFLTYLHEQGMHVTLNIHPAEGVRAYETAYEEMAKALNVDSEHEEKIDFDVSDPKFLEAYFKYLYHPNEKIGVDFWWLDWQQGGGTKKPGYNPLFLLNHFHYLDSGRDGKVPLTFSRYAGLGSHRYPIGFSGDTFATWDSLKFQPYFTATASNAGYGWWSHDIGGHMHGVKSDEMLVRWIQFGVFSPIMRIHSSDNPFFVKEPWAYDSYVGGILKRFMRLRHQLIPYLYTMNYRCHVEDELLIEPMYYRYPEKAEAYEVPNEYYFGTDLIVCPITEPLHPKLQMAEFKAWLPEGTYYDLFLGRIYHGGRKLKLYRKLDSIPVLAKAGAILPLIPERMVENDTDNPKQLEIHVFAGQSGSFTMIEDELLRKKTEESNTAFTQFDFSWGKEAILRMKLEDDDEVIPKERKYSFCIHGVTNPTAIAVTVDGEKTEYESIYKEKEHLLCLELVGHKVKEAAEICISTDEKQTENGIREELFGILDRAQIAYDQKKSIYETLCSANSITEKIGQLYTIPMDETVLGAILEVLTA